MRDIFNTIVVLFEILVLDLNVLELGPQDVHFLLLHLNSLFICLCQHFQLARLLFLLFVFFERRVERGQVDGFASSRFGISRRRPSFELRRLVDRLLGAVST